MEDNKFIRKAVETLESYDKLRGFLNTIIRYAHQPDAVGVKDVELIGDELHVTYTVIDSISAGSMHDSSVVLPLSAVGDPVKYVESQYKDKALEFAKTVKYSIFIIECEKEASSVN